MIEREESLAGELAVLREIGNKLVSTLDLAEVLEAIAGSAITLIGAQRCAVFELDPRDQRLHARVSRGMRPDQPFMPMKLGQGAAGNAALLRQPVFNPDVHHQPLPMYDEVWEEAGMTLREVVRRRGYRAILAVPMVSKETVLGAICIYWDQVHAYDEHEVRLLTALAQQAAVAIENARLYAEAREREREATRLYEVTRELATSLDLDHVLDLIAKKTVELLGCDATGIYVYNEAKGGLTFLRGLYLDPELTQSLVLRPGEGVAGRAFQERRAVWTRDRLADPTLRYTPAADSLIQAKGPRAYLAVPIISRGEVYGVLMDYYFEPHAYTPKEVQILSTLADHAAIAIENARLYEAERARKTQLDAIRKFGQEVSAELELEPLLNLIIRRAADLIGVSSGVVYTLEDQVLVPRAWWNLGTWMSEIRFRLGEGIPGIVARDGEAMIVNDYLHSAYVHPLFREHSTVTAVIALPLISKGTVVGVITLNNAESNRRFSEADLALLSLFMPQAASAIENARLFEAVQRSAAERAALLETTATINSDLSSHAVLQFIIGKAVEVIGAEKGSLLVFDQESQTLKLTASHGLSAEAVGFELKMGEGVGGKAILWKRAIAVPDVEADTEYGIRKEFARQEGIRAILIVPLLTKDKPVGVIAIYRTTPYNFPPHEIERITLFANQAAVALNNAELIDQLQTALANLEAAQEQLVRGETLRALGEMAAGAAHHLNNLLAVILGRVQLLLWKTQEPELRRALEIVERTTLDGAEVVRRIRGFTEVQPVAGVVPVDLNRLGQYVLELTRPRWQDQSQLKGISIEARLESGEIPAVAGEPAALREVLMNLLINAIEAMPNGGRITVKTWASPRDVYCSVADTGVGMTEEVRRRALEPFFTTKGPRSTGLGLSVSYGILKRHGGELAIESAEGRETTVTFHLPVTSSAAGAPSSLVPRSGQVAFLQILVIDDEGEVRRVLGEMLATLGHSVVQASEGQEGLKLLEDGKPIDMVLTDLGMPGMTGWEVAQAVKARWPRLPVGVITGWGEEPEASPEERRAADFVLAKPITLEALQKAIARVYPQPA